MKTSGLRLLLALCVLQPGCSFYYYAVENLVQAPVDARDEFLMKCRFKRMAEDEWKKVVLDDPSRAYAYHYGRGFKDGFVDYLNADGAGEPPAAPPWVYRTAAFESPQGQQDTLDWFAGFRRGAAVARDGGYREAVVVIPLALPPAGPDRKPTPASVPPPAEKPEAPSELLPPPQKEPSPRPDAKGGDGAAPVTRPGGLEATPAQAGPAVPAVGRKSLPGLIGKDAMHNLSAEARRPSRRPPQAVRLAAAAAAALLFAGFSGCAAVTNPVADGVPVDRLPPDFFPRPKEEEKTIPLTLLRQKPPDAYRLDAGDVLGVYIEGVLGDKNQPPPVHYSEVGNVPPAFGYPIPVREDGAAPLPLIGSVVVRGLTIPEAERRIVQAYTVDKKILQADRARILITLVKPRQYHVLVVRQDSGGLTFGATGALGNTKRGTGATVDLPAYENDVLNALTRTGGLPGLDAMNEVVIQRGGAGDQADPLRLGQTEACPAGADAPDGKVVRIPLRLPPNESAPFRPEDVVLQTGDIVFIEARDTEVYYTGGLLLPHQFILPRDYDLRVVDAVALAGGPLVNGLQSQNNLSGAIATTGLGSPSPSLVSVLRKTKCQGQLTIRVDLNRALRDPRENILVQPGDVLILQETPGEAITRYLTTVIRFEYLATLIRQRDLTATSTANLP